MAVELYIEDTKVDLTGDENISVDYAIAPIGDIESRTSARSVEFGLAKTTRNRALFESAEQINSTSAKPYRRLNARLFVDGVNQNISFCTLEAAADTYRCRLYGNEAGFFTLIKDAELRDFDFSDFDYYHTIANVVAKRSNTDLCFPVIKNSAIDVILPVNDIRYLPPAFSVEYLLTRICNSLGYTLNNEVLPTYNYPDNVLILPFTESKWERDTNGDRYNSTWTATTVGLNADNHGVTRRALFTLASAPTKYFDPAVISGWNGYVVLQDDLTVNYHLTITLDFKPAFYLLPYIFKIRIINGSTFIQELFPVTPPNPGGVVTYTMSGTANLSPETDFSDSNAISVEFNPGFNNLDMVTVVQLVSATLVISNAKVVTPTVVDRTPSTFKSKQFCTVSTMVPAIKQGELLKTYCQLFCAFIQVNELEKQVNIVPFNDVAAGVAQACDWSDKLDLTQEPEVSFTADKMGQKTVFDWGYAEEFVLPTYPGSYAQGIIPVANANLPAQVEKVMLPFNASQTIFSTPLSFAVIPLFDADGEMLDGAGERLVFMHWTDSSFNYTDGTTPNTAPTNIPNTYFNNPDAHNLGFVDSINSSGLLSTHYNQYAQVMDNYKRVECKLRLNASDINQLDFTRPVYIKYFNSYFYLNAVRVFSPVTNGSTTVELIKLF